MLARELGFLQGFRLSGRGPRGAIGDPRERFLILNLATVRGPKSPKTVAPCCKGVAFLPAHIGIWPQSRGAYVLVITLKGCT